MTTQTIALFGATGKVGTAILHALLSSSQFYIVQFIRPGAVAQARCHPRVESKTVDLTKTTRECLSPLLQGVDVVISAVNGKKALEAQAVIQDAAWDAGVKRFYPSEFGMMLVYRKEGSGSRSWDDDNDEGDENEDGDDDGEWGYLHPIWNTKSKCLDQVTHHPAIASSSMTYTIVDCGEIFNLPSEKTWCPWTQTDVPEYSLPIIGDSSAKIDFTHLDDLARFVVETIMHPEKSENATLNFLSDHISFDEIATLLEKYSGKKVMKNIMDVEVMHQVMMDKNDVPREFQKVESGFPVDYWFLVRGIQGEGRFWRPAGEVHNGLFPGVKVLGFEAYLKELFGG